MNNYLEVKHISSKKGKGVVTKKNIRKGTVVEVANIVLISDTDYEKIQDTIIENYIYEWDDPNCIQEFKSALALSTCQFLNHSYEPNLEYQYDYKNKAIEYLAIRDIRKGEELTTNYNGRAEDDSPVWFEVE